MAQNRADARLGALNWRFPRKKNENRMKKKVEENCHFYLGFEFQVLICISFNLFKKNKIKPLFSISLLICHLLDLFTHNKPMMNTRSWTRFFFLHKKVYPCIRRHFVENASSYASQIAFDTRAKKPWWRQIFARLAHRQTRINILPANINASLSTIFFVSILIKRKRLLYGIRHISTELWQGDWSHHYS